MNTSWDQEELQKIATTDDLHIAPFREDGKTYGTLTWIWSVVVDSQLYVRAYHGQASRWYQAAIRQHFGKIRAAGLTKEVTFTPYTGSGSSSIDQAYREKYGESPYLASMISDRARAATLQILPRTET